MIKNYRIISLSRALVVFGLTGLSTLCLSDAISDETKVSDLKKSPAIGIENLATSGKDIKVGVQVKDGTPVQTSEKYRHDVIYAQFLAQKGLRMTPDEAVKLEKQLEENPDDLNVAAQLLGFYNNAMAKNPDARKKREKLIFSLIQSHPDAAILGIYYGLLFSNDNCSEAQELWVKQVEKNPNSIPILINAATPFLLHPPQATLQPDEALAEKYLIQAQIVEPDSPIISEKLAQVYTISRRFPGVDKKDMAAKELTELTKVYKNSDSEAQKTMLPQMAKAALEIPGELGLADKQADLMISLAEITRKSRTSGDGIIVTSAKRDADPEILFYYGYFTKGMLALKKGDTDKAVEFLLKSADTSGSSGFNFGVGPNMSLAKALFEFGQKDAVIEFLGKCSKFWKNDQGKIVKWIAEIKADKTPDFGSSLYY